MIKKNYWLFFICSITAVLATIFSTNYLENDMSTYFGMGPFLFLSIVILFLFTVFLFFKILKR
jgi:uncharacterized membrane protein YhaH (DUF805 family)